MRRLLLTAVVILGCAPAAHAASATYGLASEPDYVDPALSYTLDGWSILTRTHLGLLAHDAEGRLVPAAAEALPEVSADGRTYTLRVREGLRYSNGRAVRAADFEHAIRRVLRLESGGAPFYYGIRGAARFVRSRRARDIAGITSDEAARTIRIRLVRPYGALPEILAMPFAGLVPRGTPYRVLSRRPPPGIGPLRIARSTRRGITLVKDPAFALPGFPQAALDRIAVRFTRRPGSVDAYSEPPRSVRSPDLREGPALATHWFFLNERLRPFDDPEVRRAVRTALNGHGLARRFGMRPACSLLPPGMPGHSPPDPCPFGAPDPERGREMVAAAGAAGARVSVYTHRERLAIVSARALVGAMRAVGLRPRLRVVPGSRYFTTVGWQRTRAHAGVTNWFADFPHPQNFLFLVDGDTIQPTNNQNFGNVDDQELNGLIDRLYPLPAAEAAPLAAEADRRILDQAHVIPWGHDPLRALFSARVPEECRALHLSGVDLARLCVR
jgi:peptide/nickel transport system substrate-binding protein